MDLKNANADFFVPDGEEKGKAVARTTHLCVAAHQDDIEFMAYHGALECFGRADRWFSGVTVTDGAGSPRTGLYAGCSDEDMKEIRKVEQRKAAMIGGYGFQAQLGYTSAEVKGGDERVSLELAEIVAEAAPEVVYTHNPFDKHDTHVAVFLQTLRALRALPKERRPKKLLGCECWRGLDWVNDDEKVLLDVSGHASLGPALSGVFDSQIAGGKRYDLAATGRRQANATFFASHACDEAELLQFAVDMTPLIGDDSLTLEAYAESYLAHFRTDVLERIGKFGF